jgi:YcaO-like protein with predicted kinase domain
MTDEDRPVNRIYSDRVCAPEETFRRIQPHLARYGITRLARLTSLDKIGIPVWNAVSPNAHSIVINQGKGIRDIDAKVSAAMEALERAVAAEPELSIRTASADELAAEGLRTNPLKALIGTGRDEIGPDDVVDWVCGKDLISGHDVWVPRPALTLDDTKPNRFWQSSDGLASGNTMLEAMFHGLLERIERDADALWNLTPKAERATACIDPFSFGDPVVSDLATKITTAGFRLKLFDMTSDIAIPCFSALIAPHAPSDGTISRYIEVTNGCGCHPDPVRSAIRAITEAAQSRLTYISGARDDIHPETFSRPLPEQLKQELDLPPRPYRMTHVARTDLSLAERFAEAIEHLTASRITSVIAVHLNPGIEDFAVAKMLVPQLEHPDGARKQRFGRRAVARMLR